MTFAGSVKEASIEMSGKPFNATSSFRRRRSWLLRTVSLAGIGLGLIWGMPAWANCTVPDSYWQGSWSGPPPTLLVPNKTPNGSLIATYTVSVPNAVYATCRSGGSRTDVVEVRVGGTYGGNNLSPVPGYSRMYTYGADGGPAIPGIGLVFKVNGTPIGIHAGEFPTWTIGPGGGQMSYSGTWTIEVYKIGDLDTRVAYYIPLSMGMGINGAGPYAQGQTGVIGIAATCTVSTQNVVIPLGDIDASTFASVGATSPRSRDYNIDLRCNSNPSVHMSVSGTPVAGNTDLFGLTAGATTASGIAVQLFRNGTQIVPGQNVLLTSSAGSTLSVPVAANYYRTDTVRPGSANARMVATFTYD